MLIAVFFCLLSFSFFFSGSETAFLSLGKIRLKQIEGMHDPQAKRVVRLLRDPHKLLITIIIGNEIVNVSASSIMSKLFYANFGENGVAYSIICTTCLVLVFGEVTPKMLALANAVRYSYFASFPMTVIERVLTPIRRLITAASYAIVRVLGINVTSEHQSLTKQEIKTLFSMGKKRGVVKEKEKVMIENILEFKDTKAADIMTPRINVVALDLGDERSEVVRKIKEAKFSRLPVYMHCLDNILGVICAKDFLLHPETPIRDFVRRAHFIPETKRVGDLLKEMQHKRTHLAIVTDEYGVTSGIVTIEDILEEIVGEIRDELDFENPKVIKVDELTFEVSGQAHIDEVNREVGLNIETDEVDTIGGYVMLMLGRIPQAGDRVALNGGAVIKVTDVSKNRVKALEISLE